MTPHRKLPLVIAVLILLIALAVAAYTRSETVHDSLYRVWRSSSDKMDLLVQSAAMVGLALVLGGAWLRRNTPAALESKPALRLWLIGFFVSALVVGSFIFIVNPRDLYPMRFFPNRILAPHRDKVEQYPNLSYAPDIVVIGSSRARGINDEHMQAALGLRLYNASVSSGGILDAITYARFMEATANTSTPFPKVLLIEVMPGAVREVSQRASAWPPAIFPYMDSDMLADGIIQRVQGALSIATFAESFFVIRRNTDPANDDVFMILPDGSASRPLTTESELAETIASSIEVNRNLRWCDSVDASFSAGVETFLEIIDAHHSAVIFYFSPREPRFFEQTMAQNATYPRCAAAYSEYLQSLSQTHDNVFFADYIDPNTLQLESIPEHFFDQWHLTPLAANIMIDAMVDTGIIERAYDVAVAASVAQEN